MESVLIFDEEVAQEKKERNFVEFQPLINLWENWKKLIKSKGPSSLNSLIKKWSIKFCPRKRSFNELRKLIKRKSERNSIYYFIIILGRNV